MTKSVPVPQWHLYNEGHMIAGAIVSGEGVHVEAQILLDGLVLYGSRHSSRAVAEQELAALRGRCTRDGWIDSV
jgi:hypothetical protein